MTFSLQGRGGPGANPSSHPAGTFEPKTSCSQVTVLSTAPLGHVIEVNFSEIIYKVPVIQLYI